MQAPGHATWWITAAVGALLLGGCTASNPGAAPDGAAATAVPAACESIAIRAVDAAPGGWSLAEYVLIRGPEGTPFTVTLPAGSPASVAMGESPTPGSSETRSGGLVVEQAAVTTAPATDLDPVTLQAAIWEVESLGLMLANTSGEGSSGQLQGKLGPAGTVVFRGARAKDVTFAGDCSGPSGETFPVTGAAHYFDIDTTGNHDCGRPVGAGTLAEAAAASCAAV